jgi:hypothetical protein
MDLEHYDVPVITGLTDLVTPKNVPTNQTATIPDDAPAPPLQLLASPLIKRLSVTATSLLL